MIILECNIHVLLYCRWLTDSFLWFQKVATSCMFQRRSVKFWVTHRSVGPLLGGCPIVITLSLHPSFKNFNIGHNFFSLRDRSFILGVGVPFILGMCFPYDKTFPTVQ